MKLRYFAFIFLLLIVLSGCARVVTVKDTFGDLLTVSVNFAGDISIDEEYYLILSLDSNFQVPEPPYQLEEPWLVVWNDLIEDDKNYLLDRYATWNGYIVVEAKDIYRVKGPFTTTEEAAASQANRIFMKQAGDSNYLSFNFRLSDIFGAGISLGDSIYFDIVTVTHEAGGVYLADRLDPSGNYILNEKNTIVTGSDESSSVAPCIDILDWALSIQ